MSYSTNSAEGGLSRIYDAVLSSVAAPLPVVQMAVFDAIEEFCAKSCVWRQVVTWTMPAHTAFVDLNPVDDLTLVKWIWRVTGFCGNRYRIRQPGMLVDFGDISKARTGAALVVCSPVSLNEFGLPSEIVDQWNRELREGALANLMIMPNKPWSDPKLAEFHGRRFHAGIYTAKETARLTGDLPGLRFPYFGTGSQRGYGTESGFLTDGTGTPDPGTYPIPILDDNADIDGGTFTTPVPGFDDIDGGTY